MIVRSEPGKAFLVLIPILTALAVVGAVSAENSGAPKDPQASNWPQFRGPGSRGMASTTAFPEQWSATENVAWKTDIAGRGWASPITWGNRVFILTGLSSGQVEPAKKGLYFGGERRDAPKVEHQWKLLCLDLSSGKVVW